MFYFDWSHAQWRPVQTTMEKHVHLYFLGDSKTEFLEGNVKGTNGRYTVYDGINSDTGQPTGRKPIYAHIYHCELNVPQSKISDVSAAIRARLADKHGVQPNDIEVRIG